MELLEAVERKLERNLTRFPPGKVLGLADLLIEVLSPSSMGSPRR